MSASVLVRHRHLNAGCLLVSAEILRFPGPSAVSRSDTVRSGVRDYDEFYALHSLVVHHESTSAPSGTDLRILIGSQSGLNELARICIPEVPGISCYGRTVLRVGLGIDGRGPRLSILLHTSASFDLRISVQRDSSSSKPFSCPMSSTSSILHF